MLLRRVFAFEEKLLTDYPEARDNCIEKELDQDSRDLD